jgi:hypothetical protein
VTDTRDPTSIRRVLRGTAEVADADLQSALLESRFVVQARLVALLPSVSHEEIIAALDHATELLAGARVTDYLPVLLERAALRRLQPHRGTR